jgi:hypothetical protein
LHQRLLDAKKDVRFPCRACHRCGRAPSSEGGPGRARKTSAKPGAQTAPAPLQASRCSHVRFPHRACHRYGERAPLCEGGAGQAKTISPEPGISPPLSRKADTFRQGRVGRTARTRVKPAATRRETRARVQGSASACWRRLAIDDAPHPVQRQPRTWFPRHDRGSNDDKPADQETRK